MYPNLRLKQPLISKWLKNEEYWRQQWADVGGESACKAKRIQQTLHPKITEMIELWVSKAMQARVLLTGEVLRQKWKQFAVLAGVPEDEWLKLSEGWLSRFKDRNGLKELKRYGEAASANPEHIVHERQRIQGLIRENGYHLKDVFNMDETGLFYACVLQIMCTVPYACTVCSTFNLYRLPPDRGLIDKKGPGVKGQKSRLTYAFTTNADGSEKLEPFIIGKAHKPRAFGKKTGSQLGFYYRNNAKAWMTGDLYQEWLRKWDRRLDQRTPPRKILLLQDNFSGHIIPEGLKNIRVENFRPNLTAHIQPLDQGIIRCFKAHYRAKYIERAIARYDEDITPSEIYDIDQLRAMRLANAAWQEVDTTTVRNCWHKSGILPDMDTATDTIHPSVPISALVHDTTQDPIARAEQQVNDALDVLVETGALQRSNQMDIDELLNPGDEMELIDETTDEEIFGAVMDLDTHKITLPAAGKDDADDSGPIKPPPTQSEALQAISLITDYIDSMDDPFARKLEGLLGNLSHRICIERSRAMKETVMTDYFHHL